MSESPEEILFIGPAVPPDWSTVSPEEILFIGPEEPPARRSRFPTRALMVFLVLAGFGSWLAWPGRRVADLYQCWPAILILGSLYGVAWSIARLREDGDDRQTAPTVILVGSLLALSLVPVVMIYLFTSWD